MNNTLNIVVTGASKGIGIQLVKILLDLGHRIWAVSRGTEDLEALHTNYPNLTIVPLDITGSLEPLIVSLDTHKVDVLVNNAGFLVNKPITDQSDIEVLEQYKVNAIAPIRLVREILPLFNTSYSTILNISSMGGVQGTAKFPGLLAYSSSKGALTILTECLAEELKERNVTCNALALGAVQTEMLESAFPGYKANVQPIDMANYIADFIINRAALFNGKIICVSNTTP
ncbi:MAG: SDR family oxidoreductase [Flavobacteriales bacterium]|nr:SDR family oxidoreductase [Flavobacteriales bacterium]